jgi:hypothetical protein
MVRRYGYHIDSMGSPTIGCWPTIITPHHLADTLKSYITCREEETLEKIEWAIDIPAIGDNRRSIYMSEGGGENRP